MPLTGADAIQLDTSRAVLQIAMRKICEGERSLIGNLSKDEAQRLKLLAKEALCHTQPYGP